jgi:hypothetical protein
MGKIELQMDRTFSQDARWVWYQGEGNADTLKGQIAVPRKRVVILVDRAALAEIGNPKLLEVTIQWNDDLNLV